VRGGQPSRSSTRCASVPRPCARAALALRLPTGATRSRRDRPSQLLGWRALLRVNCDDGTRRGRRTVGVFAQRLDLWLDNLLPDLRKLPSACRQHPSRIKSACAGRAGADRQPHPTAAWRCAVRGARCAVAVAPRALSTRRQQLASIGVGYDAGPESREALSPAGALAVAVGAKLRLRALVESFHLLGPDLPLFAGDRGGTTRRM
jgi:hypothetical protein